MLQVARFIPVGAGNSPINSATYYPMRVYPRGCGELYQTPRPLCATRGLSPWVRGTLLPRIKRPFTRRFIPVGAGNSIASSSVRPVTPVYPRGCGELCVTVFPYNRGFGLSPWVRGTPVRYHPTPTNRRFIPVGAGNSAIIMISSCGVSVYPRGCGELAFQLATSNTHDGLSPWVRGTRKSPVGDVNQSAVYPRGCGELPWRLRIVNVPRGLSPWVRGTLEDETVLVLRIRFIPVGAGNSVGANSR